MGKKNLLGLRLPKQVYQDIEIATGYPFPECLFLGRERVIRTMEEVGVGCWDSLQVLKEMHERGWKTARRKG
jgi:hypothetical protein